MKEALIKLQIESLEQQLKVLKSKIVSPKNGKTLSAEKNMIFQRQSRVSFTDQ